MSNAATIKALRAAGNASAAGDLALGDQLVGAGRAALKGAPSVARGAANVAGAVLKPFDVAGPHTLRGAGRIGKAVMDSPAVTKGLVAAGVLGPTLLAAAGNSAAQNTQNMLDSSNELGGAMKLSSHFIKTASFFTALGDLGAKPMVEGVAKGLGAGLAERLFSLGSSLGGGLVDKAFTSPQRQRIFEQAIKTDPVLVDAVKGNASALKNMKEAFETLVRFAPSLALDINAVRSYLREAVISGGGINYATVKQLADTEKTVADRSRFGGKR